MERQLSPSPVGEANTVVGDINAFDELFRDWKASVCAPFWFTSNHEKHVVIEGVMSIRVWKTSCYRLSQWVNIASRSPTTVYAFLSPKRPSAAWAFFCLEFVGRRSSLRAWACSWWL